MPTDNTNARYYVRTRGRVTGPHAPLELARMVRRGTLGRADQVSLDGIRWSAATVLPELFKATGDASPTAPQPGTRGVPTADAQQAPTEAGMYYAVGGENFGPMPLAILESLAHHDRLPPDAMVWEEGDSARCPASQHPLLTSVKWNVENADAGAPTAPDRRTGCGVLLTGGAILLLAAGIGIAIWVSDGAPNQGGGKQPPAVTRTAPVSPSAAPVGRPGAS